jgi:hypothetical protein
MADAFAVTAGQVIVVSLHHIYYPAQVAVLDTRGKLLRDYWHAGHLHALAIAPFKGRPAFFLGGINNARRAATLVVLDAATLGGAAREADPYQFQGFAPGRELARLIFQPSLLTSGPYNQVMKIVVDAQGVTVDVHEHDNGPGYGVIYHLDSNLKLRDIGFSDSFAKKYRQISGGRRLSHEYERLAAALLEAD